jgi:lipoprotein-anchoring transpeptidase ErfK/SrfK
VGRLHLAGLPNTQNCRSSAGPGGGTPAPDADIGGQTNHGTEDPLRNLAGQNWTKGCVSLLNKDLEEIYPLVNDQTLVVIRKD